MSINNAEQGIDNALINKVNDLERQIIELRTAPQKIGNGSVNYAKLTNPISFGPFTLAPNNRTFLQCDIFGGVITYENLPAYNWSTFMEPYVSVRVDGNTAANTIPLGSSVTGNQNNVTISVWNDYDLSGVATGGGRHYFWVMIKNEDSSSHTYYATFQMLTLRPALKPQ